MSNTEQVSWRAIWERRGEMARQSGQFETAAKGHVVVAGRWVGRQRASQLAAAVPPNPGGVALDAGCGTGDHIAFLHERGYRVIAFDFAHSMLVALQGRFRGGDPDRMRLLEGSVTELPLADHSVDLVFCQSTLTFLPEADAAAALREYARVLHPDGIAVIHIKNRDSVYGLSVRLARGMRRLLGREPHLVQHYHGRSWFRRRFDERFSVLGNFSHGLHLPVLPDRMVNAVAFLELLPSSWWTRWGVEYYLVGRPRSGTSQAWPVPHPAAARPRGAPLV
jgi:SAM-dependent methyltransferase